MKLGHIAIGHFSNQTLHLPGDKHPKGKLMKKLGVKSMRSIYTDKKDGGVNRVGYISSGEWWNIYEIHNWENKS